MTNTPTPITRTARPMAQPLTVLSVLLGWVRGTTPEEFSAAVRRVSAAVGALAGLFAGVGALALTTIDQAVEFVLTDTRVAPLTRALVEQTSIEFAGGLVVAGAAITTAAAVLGSPVYALMCRIARHGVPVAPQEA